MFNNYFLFAYRKESRNVEIGDSVGNNGESSSRRCGSSGLSYDLLQFPAFCRCCVRSGFLDLHFSPFSQVTESVTLLVTQSWYFVTIPILLSSRRPSTPELLTLCITTPKPHL